MLIGNTGLRGTFSPRLPTWMRRSEWRYKTVTGTVKRIDPYEKLLIFTDRAVVKITDIIDIEELRKEENRYKEEVE